MILNLKKALAEDIGLTKFKPFGVEPATWAYGDSKAINIAKLSPKQLNALESLFETRRGFSNGVAVIVADIKRWREARGNAAGSKPRTVQQFCTLLTSYLLQRGRGYRIFERKTDDLWLCHYVKRVTYQPAVKIRDSEHPAHVVVTLIHHEFGDGETESVSFYERDVRGKTIVEALADKLLFAETDELRTLYLEDLRLFNDYAPRVGTQFTAVGFGRDDVDGNPKGRDSSWYWRQYHDHALVRNGEPARVVVDVFDEEPKSDRRHKSDHESEPDPWFWSGARAGRNEDADDHDDDDGSDDVDANDATMTEIEVPIHPWLVVFDLARHLRLRVHARQLTPYVYDPQLVDRLVLTEERKAIVKMLIEMREGGFVDIVKGKSGGAVVLLTGKPGVGKTLTAEVFAESSGRALYSVQCSQLGIDPEAMEDELLKIFARSRRWNAVMLLDEADVYVHERGNDLQQNAIVGVFLRVLEYQSSVLFLTTNRPDDVDDAIASRCIARLSYEAPTPAQQGQIWRVLADATGAKVSNAAIAKIVSANPTLTGRDVKNLLKLARLIAEEKTGITAADVEFVKQFKPTGKG